MGFDSSLLGVRFLGDGQPDQTEGHRPREEKFKSSLVEFVVEVGRGGELGDTTGEVAKGIALAAEELGDPGHEVKEVKVPEEFPRKGWRTEFQQGKDPARLKDTVDFRKALRSVGKVSKPKGQGDQVKGVLRKGQVECISLNRFSNSPGLSPSEKRGTEIKANDICLWQPILKKKGHIS